MLAGIGSTCTLARLRMHADVIRMYNVSQTLSAGEDVGHYGGSYKCTYDLYKKYGEMRLLDTPICGAH